MLGQFSEATAACVTLSERTAKLEVAKWGLRKGGVFEGSGNSGVESQIGSLLGVAIKLALGEKGKGTDSVGPLFFRGLLRDFFLALVRDLQILVC